MFAQALSRRFAAAGVHYGWMIVAVAFVVSVTTAGAMGLPGALILPLTREFGWSADQISGALAIRILLFGLMAPFSAALIERYGLKRIIGIALSLIASALLLALAMRQVWQLFVLWGLMVGLGTGLTAIVFSAMVSTRWFTERRGLVIGILTASNATGQLAFLPLAAWIEAHYGWRAALAPTLVGLAVAGTGVALFMVERPFDVGLTPYGETGLPVAPAKTARPALLSALTTLAGASRSVTFWVLAGTFFICGLSTNGLIQTHFISLCADYGVTSVTAASMLAIIGLCDFFGTIGSGWLSDRYDNRLLLFVYYGLRGLSLIYLANSDFSLYGLSLFAVFYGLDWVATVPPTVRLTASTFGRDKAGLVFGWVYASHMIGASVAAYGGGLSRVYWQTYIPAFYLAGLACLLAALVVWLIDRKPAPAAVPARA